MISIFMLSLIGAIFRFTSLNWDAGGRLHPDEALIINGALSIQFFSQLFPGFHDYNGLSVYLVKLASLIVAFLSGEKWLTETAEGMTLVGRFLSAFFATLTIPIVYSIGTKLWNKRVGLTAALLLTFSPLCIQLAHFYTTDTLLLFLLSILLYFFVSYWKTPRTYFVIALGITAGLLLATKSTSFLMLPLPIAVLFFRRNTTSSVFGHICIFLMVCIALFFIASPYSFIDLPGFLNRTDYLSNVVSGKLEQDWTIQFRDTNGLFWIPNALYAFGPLAIVGFIGIAGTVFHKRMWRTHRSVFILALWITGFSIFLGLTYLKFIRYSAPLTPFLALFAAKWMWDIQNKRVKHVLISSVLLAQILWGTMFFHIYLVPHTSIEATNWISKNIPSRSVILLEYSNSILKFSRPELTANQYQTVLFNFYTLPDNAQKSEKLNTFLRQSDYIILESPKGKNTVLRHKYLYPYASRFYERLIDANPEFTNIATFTSYPMLGPLVLNDESSEETFTVFDHPTITIYKVNHLLPTFSSTNRPIFYGEREISGK